MVCVRSLSLFGVRVESAEMMIVSSSMIWDRVFCLLFEPRRFENVDFYMGLLLLLLTNFLITAYYCNDHAIILFYKTLVYMPLHRLYDILCV